MQVRRMILRGLSSLPTDLARPHSRGFLYRLSTFWLILFQSTNEPGSTQQTKKNESIQVLRAIAIRKASNAGNSPADRRNTFARLHSLRRQPQRRRQQDCTQRHPKLVPGGRVGSSRRYDYGRSRLPLHADSLFPRSAWRSIGRRLLLHLSSLFNCLLHLRPYLSSGCPTWTRRQYHPVPPRHGRRTTLLPVCRKANDPVHQRKVPGSPHGSAERAHPTLSSCSCLTPLHDELQAAFSGFHHHVVAMEHAAIQNLHR